MGSPGLPPSSRGGLQECSQAGRQAGVQTDPKGVLQAGAQGGMHQGAKAGVQASAEAGVSIGSPAGVPKCAEAGVQPGAQGDVHPLLPVPRLRTANLWQVDPQESPYHIPLGIVLFMPLQYL